MKPTIDSSAKKVKKTKLSIFRLLFFAAVFVLSVRMIWSLFITHPKTEIVRYGNLEFSENVTGYVFKNETVIQSPISGAMSTYIPDGTKVKKGISVATVVKDGTDQQYTEKVKKIDDEIVKANDNNQKNNIFEGDSQKLDERISQELNNVYTLSKSGEIDKLGDVKASLNELLEKKLIVTGESGFSNTNIKAKIKERENYLSYINSSKVDIPTSTPGILSYNIDGYEQLFSPKNLVNVTSKTLEKLNFNSTSEPPAKVTSGQPIVKIIDNFEWYILCVMKSNKVAPLKENDYINIALNDGTKVPAKVTSIKNENNGTSLVTLMLTNNLEQFYNLRKVDIKLIKRNYEGIKIPTSSIIDKESKRGVMIVDRGITRFKEIDIIGFDQKYAIVEVDDELGGKKGLLLFNEIVVNPSFINEGILIR